MRCGENDVDGSCWSGYTLGVYGTPLMSTGAVVDIEVGRGGRGGYNGTLLVGATPMGAFGESRMIPENGISRWILHVFNLVSTRKEIGDRNLPVAPHDRDTGLSVVYSK